MRYAITTPPTGRPVDWTIAKPHLRLDTDTDQSLVELFIDAAAQYAQDAMECSLLTQTITATYTAEDVGLTAPQSTAGAFDPFTPQLPVFVSGIGIGRAPFVRLPRGPVQSVTSVHDANGNTVPGCSLTRAGNIDRLTFAQVPLFPVTVVYVAGTDTADAMVKLAILCHVGTMYEQRESVTKDGAKSIPQLLETFYQLRSRTTGVG